jgi:hypothetical protein
MDTYRVRIKPRGAILWKDKSDVALHDATVDAVKAAIPAVFGKPVKPGDRVEVFAGYKRILRFTA